jgi:Uma2 family endonuclease
VAARASSFSRSKTKGRGVQNTGALFVYTRAMGAKTAISVEEYLRTSYPDLDKEYRDGEVLERTMPDLLHSRTQILLGTFFVSSERASGLYACTELRVQIAPNVFRIPDVSVFPGKPAGSVPKDPPLIAVEILSPDDRMSEVLNKLEEFQQWGVHHVWLVDPHAKRMYSYDGSLTPAPALRIPEVSLEIKPSDIFE